jgi:hypothetical protein
MQNYSFIAKSTNKKSKKALFIIYFFYFSPQNIQIRIIKCLFFGFYDYRSAVAK